MLKRLWRVLIAVPPLWILVLNQLLFGQVGMAFGHSDAIVKCKGNIKYSTAVKVHEDLLFSSNGLYAEYYDTNGDGKYDVITLSSTNLTNTTHRVNPVFWIVDTDFDGTPDAVYIDKKGLGKCPDIVLYQDLNAKPLTNETDPIDRGGRL